MYLGLFKDGTKVAIKRIKAEGEMGVENNFITEVELISRFHYYNVVHLLGFCSENQGKHTERLLIFENMPRGNLRECRNEATTEFLDSGSRVSIALGAAKGLEYLHEAVAPRIMHRDIKSTNILLDEDWRAKKYWTLDTAAKVWSDKNETSDICTYRYAARGTRSFARAHASLLSCI